MLTAKQAAERIGVTDARVRQLAIAGKLPGTKHGRDWVFDEADVDAYRREKAK